MTRPYTKRPIAERFWGKVDKTNDCWVWNACKVNGYGRFYPTRERLVLAHRWAYEQEYGPIPEELQIDHVCHNESDCPGGVTCLHRACVRPDHLRVATPRENTLAGKTLPAAQARRTHGPCGHPYDRITSQGRRECSRCRLQGHRDYHQAHKVERNAQRAVNHQLQCHWEDVPTR